MPVKEAFEVAGAVIASLGGGSLIVAGSSTWLGKVWADRILEKDRRRYQEELEHVRGELQLAQRRLQAELDKSVHVHRLQFETEYRTLIELWEKLSSVRLALEELNPFFDTEPQEGETYESRQHKRLEVYASVLNPLIRAEIAHGPFCPEAIHSAIWEAIRIAKMEGELTRFLPGSKQKGEWQQARLDGRAKFIAATESVSGLIREYLEQLRSST